MRTLKSILVLGLALSTFTAAEAAKLTFKVTNPNEKVKVILTFSQSGEQKEVAIDAAGNGAICNHAIHTRTPYPLFGP